MDIQPSYIAGGILACGVLALGRYYFAGTKCPVSKDLKDKIVIITGSSSGIGLEIARGLAAHNATIIFACRSEEKTKPLIAEIQKETGNSNLIFMKIDFNDLATVKQFAKNFKEKYNRLDVLVNNIGGGQPQRTLTEDKLEYHFQVNYLGSYYLTRLLLDILKKTGLSRVISVSSMGQRSGYFNWDDLMHEKKYTMLKAYSQSKLSLVTFTRELQKRLEGSQVKAIVLDPGVTRTDGFRNVKREMLSARIAAVVFRPFILYFTKSSMQGAQTPLYCAMEDLDKLEGGAYYSECKVASVNSLAKKEDNQKRLWEESEKILQEKLGKPWLDK